MTVTAHDGEMTEGDRKRRWAVVITAGVLVAGLGSFLAVQGLDKAGKWAGVFGVFVGLAGLGLSVSGAVGARRQSRGQSVTDSSVGVGVTQVRGVRGNVRIGPSAPAPATPSAPAAPQPPIAGPRADGVPTWGGQSVTRSWTTGPVRQVDGVDGDVDVDR
ncbi:hypothetical protein [Micromonospora sicca]